MCKLLHKVRELNTLLLAFFQTKKKRNKKTSSNATATTYILLLLYYYIGSLCGEPGRAAGGRVPEQHAAEQRSMQQLARPECRPAAQRDGQLGVR
jgi:hypothetical protein